MARIEIRDGKEYRVTVLPPSRPRKKTPKSGYGMAKRCFKCLLPLTGKPAVTGKRRNGSQWYICRECHRVHQCNTELDRLAQEAASR